jgi:exopolysaccharide biosynthesis predicted pyruvyltransferase EpsI
MSVDDANARHRERLFELYRPLIDPSRPVALVDFQDTKNCGDHAIWLGQRTLLRELGVEVVHECGHEDYDKAAMAKALGKGTILISGGGSFGDLYPDYMILKLNVLKDFPDNEIIFFPQTAMFFTNAVLDMTVAAVAKHGKVTLTARDLLSHRTLTTAFGDKARVVLAPDMACMLTHLKRDVEPVFDVVWISRDDGESTGGLRPQFASGLSLKPRRFKLEDFDDPIKIDALGRVGGPTLFATDWYRLMVDDQSLEIDYPKLTMEQRSQVWVARAVRLLSLGKVVVTDRLHGHILCTLIGVPHILLNNSYGKNFAYFESWSRPSATGRLAASPERAWNKAQAMASKVNTSDPSAIYA